MTHIHAKRYWLTGVQLFYSLYRFWHYPSSSRLRLSQFVILPPYHKQSNGTQLYSQVYQQVLSQEAVSELTVEDPNEAFDRLRDSADLKTLLQPGGVISQMKQEPEGLKAPLSRKRSEKWRAVAKIAKRQWSRLIEASGSAHGGPFTIAIDLHLPPYIHVDDPTSRARPCRRRRRESVSSASQSAHLQIQ